MGTPKKACDKHYSILDHILGLLRGIDSRDYDSYQGLTSRELPLHQLVG